MIDVKKFLALFKRPRRARKERTLEDEVTAIVDRDPRVYERLAEL